MEFNWSIFILGCVGAAAPEIVRIYKCKTKELKIDKKMVLISILFFSLGGVIAWILPATTLWGAFYVGVSAPSIISGITANIRGSATQVKPTARPRGSSGNMGLMFVQSQKFNAADYVAILWR